MTCDAGYQPPLGAERQRGLDQAMWPAAVRTPLQARRTWRPFIVALALLAAGCVSSRIAGSRAIPVDRFDFNEAVISSWNEQLLLNLVRLRYQDTPLFMDVGNIVTQYAFTGNLGLGVAVPGDSVALSPGLSYSARPTITYKPLTGEAFAERLLTPISPLTLTMLSQSGWSLELLLLTCVQEVNNIGDLFDWQDVTGGLLRIHSSPTRPQHAFAAVRYRGYWFYIEDAAIHSKTTFGLLTYLFSLQSAGPEPFGPILTLPADR